VNIEPLPPIPSPPEHHWRQFRINILPSLTFLAVTLAAVWLWGKNLSNPLVMAQAEAVQADVTSFKAGRIARLHVMLYQDVQAGDLIAEVDAADPLILSNTVAVIRAEMDLIRINAGLDAGDKVRLAGFQLSWMESRAELLANQAQLAYAQREFDRISTLYAEKLETQAILDLARSTRDQYAALVEQQTLAVAAAEQAMRGFDPTAAAESPAIKTELALAEQNLHLAEAELQPILLRAPISGRINRLDKMPGASVAAGDVIVTVASPTSERIVGYLSQPLRIEPVVGMKVQVRSRGLVRAVSETHITHVGARIEMFDAPLRVRGMGAAQERGLPIVMAMPPNFNVRPGELLEVRLLVD
jgi:multidrug resistance efflux pump